MNIFFFVIYGLIGGAIVYMIAYYVGSYINFVGNMKKILRYIKNRKQ